MKLSARNVLKGKVAGIEPGAVTTIVKIDLGGGMMSTSARERGRQVWGRVPLPILAAAR